MMQQNAHARAQKPAPSPTGLAICAAVVLFAAVSAGDARAQSRVKGEYANSRSPLYRVGDINPKLSSLCRRGLFKQRRDLRLSIGYIGPNGEGITGIAQKGWNLYDPTGAAVDDRTYHFYNQGHSNCRVYEAVTPPPPEPQAPPQQ